MKHECKRCHRDVSFFWWPFTIGYNCNEEPTDTFELCDHCIHDFLKFMEGKE